MSADPSRPSTPATPLSAPWADEQPQTHHTPTPTPHRAANEGNDMDDQTIALRDKIIETWSNPELGGDRPFQARMLLTDLAIEDMATEAAETAIRDRDQQIAKQRQHIEDMRGECRDLAKELAEANAALAAWRATEPRPLAVGDRVRVIEMIGQLAEGDVGTIVVDGTGADGDAYGFQRDGTERDAWVQVAAANVERIEDEPHIPDGKIRPRSLRFSDGSGINADGTEVPAHICHPGHVHHTKETTR